MITAEPIVLSEQFFTGDNCYPTNSENLFTNNTDKRQNTVIGIIGGNATGKTRLIKELIKKSNGNEEVYCFDPNGGLKDCYTQKIECDMEWAVNINKKAKNSLVVLDDFKNLTPNYIPTPMMRDLFINRRYHNNDYIYALHNYSDIMKMLTYFTTHYYIFPTKTINPVSNKALNSELIQCAIDVVNRVKKCFDYPYGIVDVQNNTFELITTKK